MAHSTLSCHTPPLGDRRAVLASGQGGSRCPASTRSWSGLGCWLTGGSLSASEVLVPSGVVHRVPDVLAAGHREVLVEEQAEHVDAARLLLPFRGRLVGLKEHPQLLPLARVDCLLGQAEGHPAPGLD